MNNAIINDYIFDFQNFNHVDNNNNYDIIII